MANFNTHLAVAAGISGLAATLCLRVNVFTGSDIVLCFAAGVLGGILPDADSDSSTAIKIVFNVIAIAACIGFAVGCSTRFPVDQALLIVATIYIGVRFGIAAVFAKFTVHRGLFHSLIAVVLSSLMATSIAYYNFGFDPLRAWLVGAFLGGGYLVHLILDECYSVDLLNNKIKRSFGSALKLGGSVRSTVAAIVVAAVLGFHAPSPTPFNAMLQGYVPGWTQLQTTANTMVAQLKRVRLL